MKGQEQPVLFDKPRTEIEIDFDKKNLSTGYGVVPIFIVASCLN